MRKGKIHLEKPPKGIIEAHKLMCTTITANLILKI